MAIDLNGSSQYLDTSTLPVSDVPLTMCVWVKLDQLPSTKGDEQCAAAFGDDSAIRFLNLRADDTSDKLQFNSGPLPTAVASTTNSVTAGVWEHWCGIAAADDDRRSILNGNWANSGTSSVSKDQWAFLDNFNVGRMYMTSTGYDYVDGKIGMVTVFNVALSQAQVEALAAGFHPKLVAPNNIVAHWELMRDPNDRWGTNNLTEQGTPSYVSDFPPVVYPAMRNVGVEGEAVAGATIPIMYHHYTKNIGT